LARVFPKFIVSLLVSLEEVYAVKNLAAVRKFAYQCIVLSMVFLVSPEVLGASV
jgi:hypothetical protein